MTELLSPAGSPEAVIAAVQNGADAVYLGMGNFNARRGAKNFTEEEFQKAVRYCRIRGCKVYVTLNTLVGDREVESAVNQARLASALGADGLIVQDLGLVRALHATRCGQGEEIYIGQGWQGQTLEGLGIGKCCRGAEKCVMGCPPTAEASAKALEALRWG